MKLQHFARRLRPAFLTVLALVGQATILAGQAATAPYFPEAGRWEHRSPAAMGMDAAKLAEAVRFIQAGENPQPRDLSVAHWLSWGREPNDAPLGPFTTRGDVSGLVIRNGYIVAEWGDTRAVEMTFSVTKSFLSTTIGVMWDRGYLPDLKAPVGQLVRTGHFESEHNRKITWDHLLRQSSDWEGTLWSKPDWVDRPASDLAAHMTRSRDEPGTVYKYNDVRVNLLAFAALNVLRQPLPDYLREHIMEPIGASPTWRWHGYDNSWVEIDGQRIQSMSGGGHWGGGMFISAEDLARFGYLTMRQGRWKDRQLISREWLAMAETPGLRQPRLWFHEFLPQHHRCGDPRGAAHRVHPPGRREQHRLRGPRERPGDRDAVGQWQCDQSLHRAGAGCTDDTPVA